ncbi:hypothetical protein GCM10016455_28190 [Aliiroseovarius zhejiangensis]|uniref:DUF2793 domain-containing protein n=1 Tax=Aliiroseovarius zhejiangensis TaxID=1632025 RepID=A0ABQ3J994_9RHOB|nr:DUF2793 domain-containing protein [Aliiroseovarius zhejiangensis]GHF05279.1 hypothetical protein GCM10016455_28190 [Aliiroseovarius zhejiangensis]
MPNTSPILSLPLIQPAQAQKHVTHNEALRLLDILVQLSVETADTISPPPGATEGNRHIVPGGATGDWAGQEQTITWLQDGVWQFIAPQAGWRADVTATAQHLRYDGSQWVDTAPSMNNLDLLGVNTTADATNKLAVASDATLLSHDGTSHQVKINKASASDTASMLFQSNWSGRAEFGLTGDDDFHVKTSPDGSTWAEAIVATGTGDVGIGKSPAAKLDVDGVMRLTPTATASLPAAASVGAGGVAFVSDAAGGAQLAYSDGSSWLKVSDGSAI